MDGGGDGAGPGIDAHSGVDGDRLDPPLVHPAVKPPSTTSSAPVMNEDSSLARNSAT